MTRAGPPARRSATPRRCVRTLAAFAWLLLAGTGVAAADGCGPDAPCTVASGSYRAAPPPGWDGRSPLPTALFFHGFGGSAADGMADAALREAFAAAGILLIAPDGLDGRWSHRIRPGARDDFGFVDEVLADVRQRWPVDEARLFASGFSSGAFVVWDLACHKGGFRAYVPIAGAFIGPVPERCTAGPFNLLEIHGLTDGTVPIEGRLLRQGLAQADLFASFALARRTASCRSNPDRYETADAFVVRLWDESCAGGARLAMALHPGGHVVPDGWLDVAWPWIQALPR